MFLDWLFLLFLVLVFMCFLAFLTTIDYSLTFQFQHQTKRTKRSPDNRGNLSRNHKNKPGVSQSHFFQSSYSVICTPLCTRHGEFLCQGISTFCPPCTIVSNKNQMLLINVNSYAKLDSINQV